MIPIREDPPAAAERAIDRTGDADGEPLEPADELRGRVGLYQQMQVVTLH